MKNIAIFASGSGSNAQAIIEYFKNKNIFPVKLILTNNANAFVLERAKKFNIPSVVFTRDDFYASENVLESLANHQIDFIVLAGFLWLVPQNILQRYNNKVVNIHPALLPKYGGKGMYGMKVHEAVVANNETETGITIHYVNEIYDNGKIILQAACAVLPADTPEMVAEKVHVLEHKYFPKAVEDALMLS